MAVPYTFGSATTSIPLSQLDSNFATPITLGNTAVQLGNTITNLTGITNLASSGALTLGSNGNTTAIYIDTSQNVGIGASPSTKLDVNGPSGNTSFTGTNAMAIVVRGASGITDYSAIDFRNSSANSGSTAVGRIGVIAGSAGSSMSFGTSNSYVGGITNTAMTINPSGNVQHGASISVGNVTPSTSGAGVTFPATQSASTDANTLDDYEEGTWTPVLTPASGTITSSSVVGNYVKIGRQVTLNWSAQITGGTVTAISSLGGFPFVVIQGLSVSASGPCREFNSTGLLWCVTAGSGATLGQLINYANGSNVAVNYGWSGTFVYQTN